MPEVLTSRTRPLRTYAAIALFLAVYAGVMVLVLAPRDLIAAHPGSAVYTDDN